MITNFIPIFEAEKQNSLAEKILKNTSVSFLAQPEEASIEERQIFATAENLIRSLPDHLDFAKAEINDEDLFYHKAILVTTNWNGNDDVFMPDVAWSARKSPVHKPTNFNHQSSKIVGHITGSWGIDADQKLIDDSVSIGELPSKFHILTGSVIYKTYHNDPEYQEEVATLIREIGEGKQFVSMECSFKHFDYALMSANGKLQILERNNNTAFLTKHLRMYGGAGVYENKKLGRVLRDISFIGKAYTPRPANKESIIFTKNDLFDFANASFSENYDNLEKNSVVSDVTLDFNGDYSMSDVLQDQNKELKAAKADLEAEVKRLGVELAKADVQKYEAKVNELTEALAKNGEEFKEMKEKWAAKNKEAADNKAKADELETEVAALRAKVTAAETAAVYASRVSYLVDNSFARETAEAKATTFANLNDEQFKAIADELIQTAKERLQLKEKAEADTKVEDTSDADVSKSADLDATKVDSTESVTTASETTAESDDNQITVSIAQKLELAATKKAKKGDK